MFRLLSHNFQFWIKLIARLFATHVLSDQLGSNNYELCTIIWYHFMFWLVMTFKKNEEERNKQKMFVCYHLSY